MLDDTYANPIIDRIEEFLKGIPVDEAVEGIQEKTVSELVEAVGDIVDILTDGEYEDLVDALEDLASDLFYGELGDVIFNDLITLDEIVEHAQNILNEAVEVALEQRL